MMNSASKCLKITLNVIKFSKPEKKKKKKKIKLRGISPLESFEGGLIPPLAETLTVARTHCLRTGLPGAFPSIVSFEKSFGRENSIKI
jgi:hypothetical protein